MRFLMIFALTLLSQLALAADLTTKDVEQWLNSAPQLQTWLEEQEDKLAQAPGVDDPSDIEATLQQAVNQLKEVGVYDELTKKVKAAGYQDAAHWLAMSQQVSMAYMAIVIEQEAGSRDELTEQLKQLKSMGLPEDSLQMMEGMLQSALAMFDMVLTVPAADKAAVRPYMSKLAELLGE